MDNSDTFEKWNKTLQDINDSIQHMNREFEDLTEYTTNISDALGIIKKTLNSDGHKKWAAYNIVEAVVCSDIL